MKIRWKKVFYFMFLLGSMFGIKNAVGQNDSIQKSQNQNIVNKYSISGQIFETDNKTTIPFCNIVLIDQNNKQIAGATTNFDGVFTIKEIPYGKYTIRIYFVGYKSKTIEYITSEQKTNINIILEETSTILCYDVIIFEYKIPLIDPKNTTSGETIDSEDIKNMPFRR